MNNKMKGDKRHLPLNVTYLIQFPKDHENRKARRSRKHKDGAK